MQKPSHIDLSLETVENPCNTLTPGQKVLGRMYRGIGNEGTVFDITTTGSSNVDGVDACSYVSGLSHEEGLKIVAYDPDTRTSFKLQTEWVMRTSGSDHYLSQQYAQSMDYAGPGKQDGRVQICASVYKYQMCRFGVACRDIHVIPVAFQFIQDAIERWMNFKKKEFQQKPATSTFVVFMPEFKDSTPVPKEAIAFTRGLFVSSNGGDSRKNERPRDMACDAPHISSPSPCRLYLDGPRNCSWGEWCNQAHINSAWYREYRKAFDEWTLELHKHFTQLQSKAVFAVHDMIGRRILHVPKSLVESFYTRGLVQGRRTRWPSVCLLYQKGSCMASSCCNQVHFHPAVLSKLRAEAGDRTDEQNPPDHFFANCSTTQKYKTPPELPRILVPLAEQADDTEQVGSPDDVTLVLPDRVASKYSSKNHPPFAPRIGDPASGRLASRERYEIMPPSSREGAIAGGSRHSPSVNLPVSYTETTDVMLARSSTERPRSHPTPFSRFVVVGSPLSPTAAATGGAITYNFQSHHPWSSSLPSDQPRPHQRRFSSWGANKSSPQHHRHQSSPSLKTTSPDDPIPTSIFLRPNEPQGSQTVPIPPHVLARSFSSRGPSGSRAHSHSLNER